MPLEDAFNTTVPKNQEEIEKYNQIGNRYFTENVQPTEEPQDPNQEGGLDRFSLSDAAAYTPAITFDDFGDIGRTTYFSKDIAGNEISRFQSYGTEIYGDFGFNPYRDNNEFYNANTSDWVDFGRALDGMWKLAGVGFKDTFAFGLFHDPDNYKDFGQIMSDYSSTKNQPDSDTGETESTWTKFFSNTMLSAGYTVGIVGGIAAEELALFGLGTGVSIAGRSLKNTARLSGGKVSPWNVWRMMRRGAKQADRLGYQMNMFRTLRELEGARTWVGRRAQSLGRGVGQTAKALAPFGNTMDFARGVDKAAFRHLSNLEKGYHGAAALARDARKFYLAHSESKLESNFAEEELVKGLIEQWQMEHPGQEMSDEKFEDILLRGEAAYEKAYASNFGLIYLTNGLLFEGLLKGFKPTSARLGRGFQQVGKGKEFEFIRAVEKTGKSYLKDKWRSVTPFKLRNWATYPSGAFRMSMEGVQEVGQDIIHKAALRYAGVDKNEETGLFEVNNFDPDAVAWYQGLGNYWDNLKDSSDASSWETFFTGLLIGPFVAPVNAGSQLVRDIRGGELGAVFESQQEDVKTEYEKRKRDAAVLTEYFQTFENDAEFIKHIRSQSNLRLTKDSVGKMVKAAREGNHKYFEDHKGDLFRYGTELILEHGLESEIVDHLESLKRHTVAELNNTTDRNDITEENKAGFLKEVEGYIDRFRKLRTEKTKIERLNINQAAFYKTGDPVQDLITSAEFIAYEDYKRELFWNADKIEEVKQRLERTIGALTEQDLLTRDKLNPLLDSESAQLRIEQLEEEIAKDDEYKIEISQPEKLKKQNELDALKKYKDVLQKIENAKEKEQPIDSLKSELKQHFEDYVNTVGNTTGQYGYYNTPTLIDLSSKFNTLFDTLELQDDLAYYIEAGKVAISPEFATQFVREHFAFQEKLGASKKEFLERSLALFQKKKTSDDILADFLRSNMFFDLNGLEDLLERNIMPKEIYYKDSQKLVSQEDYIKAVRIAEKHIRRLKGKSLSLAGAEGEFTFLQQSKKRKEGDNRTVKGILRQYAKGNKSGNKMTLDEVLKKLLTKGVSQLNLADIELINKLNQLIISGSIDASTGVILTDTAIVVESDKEGEKDIVYGNRPIDIMNDGTLVIDVRYASSDYAINIPQESIDKEVSRQIKLYKLNNPKEETEYTEEELNRVEQGVKNTLSDQTVTFEYLLLSGIVTQQIAKKLENNEQLVDIIVNFMDTVAEYVAHKYETTAIVLKRNHPEFTDPVAFLREALTNFDFQFILSEMSYAKDEGAKSSVWQNFRSALAAELQKSEGLFETGIDHALGLAQISLDESLQNLETKEEEVKDEKVGEDKKEDDTTTTTEEEVVVEEDEEEETVPEKINRLKRKKENLEEERKRLRAEELNSGFWRNKKKLRLQQENIQKEIAEINNELNNLSPKKDSKDKPLPNQGTTATETKVDENGNLEINKNTQLSAMSPKLQFQLMLAYVNSNFAPATKQNLYLKYASVSEYSDELFNSLIQDITEKELEFIQNNLNKPIFNDILRTWVANNAKSQPETTESTVTSEDEIIVEEEEEKEEEDTGVDITFELEDELTRFVENIDLESLKRLYRNMITYNKAMSDLYSDAVLQETLDEINEAETVEKKKEILEQLDEDMRQDLKEQRALEASIDESTEEEEITDVELTEDDLIGLTEIPTLSTIVGVVNAGLAENGANLSVGDVLAIRITKIEEGDLLYGKYDQKIEILNPQGETIGFVSAKGSIEAAILESDNPQNALVQIQYLNPGSTYTGGKFKLFVDGVSTESTSGKELQLKNLLDNFNWTHKVSGQLDMFSQETENEIRELVKELGRRGKQLYDLALVERANKEEDPKAFRATYDFLAKEIKEDDTFIPPSNLSPKEQYASDLALRLKAAVSQFNEENKNLVAAAFELLDNKPTIRELVGLYDMLKMPIGLSISQKDEIAKKIARQLNNLLANPIMQGMTYSTESGVVYGIIELSQSAYEVVNELTGTNLKDFPIPQILVEVIQSKKTEDVSEDQFILLNAFDFLSDFQDVLQPGTQIGSPLDIGVDEGDAKDIKISFSIFKNIEENLDEYNKLKDKDLTNQIIDQLNKC